MINMAHENTDKKYCQEFFACVDINPPSIFRLPDSSLHLHALDTTKTKTASNKQQPTTTNSKQQTTTTNKAW